MPLERLDVVESPRECALSVDFTVRSGTANIFTKQQQFRSTWVGESLSTTNIYLEANTETSTSSQKICGPFTTIILNCEYPVKLTYYDPSTGIIVQHECRQLWIADITLEQLIIENASERSNAVVVTTMYNKEDDSTITEDDSSSESTDSDASAATSIVARNVLSGVEIKK